MTIDEIQSALRFDMDMMLFDANTGKTYPKESLKYGNEMNYIHYCAEEQAIELLDELKQLKDEQCCHKVVKENWMDTKCKCGHIFSKSFPDGYYCIPYENRTNYCPDCGIKLIWEDK